MKRILVVDDDSSTRESLRRLFENEYTVLLSKSAAEALGVLASSSVDLVLLDVIMPQKDGLTLLRELLELFPELPVIMISASTDTRPVVEAIQTGAVDFVTKPFDIHELRQLVARSFEHRRLKNRVRAMETDLSSLYPLEGLIGESPPFQAALSDARRAAKSDATVLIQGESGTGKEMVARQIHTWSSRNHDPFVAVHCASIPESLIESELFGHEKGAFTNATQQKPGRFDLAGSGTLFLDEVGEMPASTQVKLLRVLQEMEYMRLGGTRVLHTNARILAATNRDLAGELVTGRFREDLYYRLNVIPIRLPGLRERKEDIPLLVKFFVSHFQERLHTEAHSFTPEAMQALCDYSWPGNIRELRNIIERGMVLHGDQPVLDVDVLPIEFHTSPPHSSTRLGTLQENLSASVDQVEHQLVLEALRSCGGVQTKAAEMLGTTRRVLKYKMDKLNIQLPLEDPLEAPLEDPEK
ncbi:MAG: sigma-54 dependent transcriptional regulator [Kiritimatiellia bacterium]